MMQTTQGFSETTNQRLELHFSPCSETAVFFSEVIHCKTTNLTM